jgi:hypothetical protein
LALDEAQTRHLPTHNSKEAAMSQTYLTTEELSAKIKYDPRTIREQMKDSVLAPTEN